MYCWSLAWRILSFTSLWDECNYAVVWAFFGIAFLRDWNENGPFPVLLNRFSQVQLFVTLWTVAHQAPLSIGFSRQEYWTGLICLPPGNLPDPGIESLMSLALAGGFFTTSTTWKAGGYEGKHWNSPPFPGKTVATYMSFLTTRSPGKGLETNKFPTTRRIWERSKWERRYLSLCPVNLPESFSLESFFVEWCAHHQEGPLVKMIGQRQLEN